MPLRWLLSLLVATPALADTPVPFRNDVQAVLTRAGCNAGACHGNLNGKGGFKLSLKGEDADADRTALTRGMLGRRTDTQNPTDSLVLQKATGQVPHEGGARFSILSTEYSVLRRWIETGALPDPEGTPKLKKLSVNGQSHVLVEPIRQTRITATATYSDGTTRDVTNLVSFELNSVGVAKVLMTGEVVREQFGEVVVLVRYLDRQVPVRVAFLSDRPQPDLSKLPANNAIDKLVYADLARLRVTPSELCSDSVFIRRAYLDACGITPTAAEVSAFLADTASDKRAKLIDRLLERPEYPAYWAQKWSDLLRNEEKALDKKGVQVFHRWIRTAVAADKPLTEFARDILAARGSTYTTPPANFYRAVRDPYLRAESVAQVFLGLRVSCARCHNHPFDVWTQDDYHRFAAVFARVDYRVIENNRKDDLDKHEFVGEQIVYAKPAGELPLPRGGDAAPKFLGANTPDLSGRADRLAPLADWVTSPDNPFFAKAQANRVWAHLLGRGVVDPIDDFKAANPPTNPELLDHLATTFAAGGYRLKPLIRHVMTSRVYQLSASPNSTNEADETHFSRALVQPLEAEQLMDAVANALGTDLKLPGYPTGTRAGEMAAIPMEGRRQAGGSGMRFLKVFGKPERLLTCECERSEDPGVLQAFQMMTGELMNGLLRKSDNRIGRLIAADTPAAEMLDDLYLSAVARRPTAAESKKLLDYVSAAPDRRASWEDVTWGLLNSKEFLLRR
jgi:Protein of unknown function (DUF1553)/Protein of unknown function (DUF1549)